jgi:hypothetical protein
MDIEEDAADRDARLAARKRAAEEAALERRSTAIKKELPRPVAVNAEAFKVGCLVGARLWGRAWVEGGKGRGVVCVCAPSCMGGWKASCDGGVVCVQVGRVDGDVMVQADMLIQEEMLRVLKVRAGGKGKGKLLSIPCW